MRICILLAFVVLLAVSCNNRSSSSVKELIVEDTIIPQGIKNGVLNVMTAQTDQSCRYGLYIPKDSCKSYPLIVIFDPHAAGNHAASQYQDLANKYKIILAASNNVQNNMPTDKFAYYTNCMIDDVLNNCSIDSSFVYLMGFSGGARVASYMAQTQNVFRGVIGCGAGIQDIVNIKTSNFLYVGYAGYSDFNFSEVYKSEQALNQSQVKAHFKYFEGKHEWPPDSVMEYAFVTIALDLKENSNENVLSYLKKEMNNCKTIPIRDAWKKVVSYRSMRDLLNNTTGYEKEKAIINTYLSGYESKTAERSLSNSIKSEYKSQAELQKAFNENDQQWWEKKIAQLNLAKDKKDKSPADYRDIRLVSYISMACYMLINSALMNEDLVQVNKFLPLYRSLDPKNPYVSYFNGVSLVISKQYQAALDSLANSLQNGFTDKGKWQSERVFIPLKDSLRFLDLESKLNAVQ